jgi:hypothetical protein
MIAGRLHVGVVRAVLGLAPWLRAAAFAAACFRQKVPRESPCAVWIFLLHFPAALCTPRCTVGQLGRLRAFLVAQPTPGPAPLRPGGLSGAGRGSTSPSDLHTPCRFRRANLAPGQFTISHHCNLISWPEIRRQHGHGPLRGRPTDTRGCAADRCNDGATEEAEVSNRPR